MPDSNAIYDYIRNRYNHYPLTDGAYNALKDLKDTGKKVRIAGKVLLVAGVFLDALELYLAVDLDLKDADRKLGETTSSTVFSIAGRWGGGFAGAKFGAAFGAMTGPSSRRLASGRQYAFFAFRSPHWINGTSPKRCTI